MTLGKFRYLPRIGDAVRTLFSRDELASLDQRDRQLEDYLSSVGSLADALRALGGGFVYGDGAGGFTTHPADRTVLISNTSTFTTSETTILTSSTLTFDGSRRIRISASLEVNSSVAGDDVGVYLKEGSTYLAGRYATDEIRYASGTSTRIVLRQAVLTPSAASHTYTLVAKRVVGSGNLTAVGGEGGTWLVIEDMGPT